MLTKVAYDYLLHPASTVVKDWRTRISWGLIILCALSNSVSFPTEAIAHPMSINDVLGLEALDRATVSPDGHLLATVILRKVSAGEVYGREPYGVDPSRADVWIVDRVTGARRDLTHGHDQAAGAWCATWSPDGNYLAFLSTRPEGREPRGGKNVRLYVWDRRTDRVHRVGERAVMSQTRHGEAIHKLDIAGPGAISPSACAQGDENPPFVWLDQRRLLVAALPHGQVSGLLDASGRIEAQINTTREAIRTGSNAIVSSSGSGGERTREEPLERAIIAIVDIRGGKWHELSSIPAYPFNGSLSVRVTRDGRRAAVLASNGGLAPYKGMAFVSNDGEWLVEKRLALLDLSGTQPIQWISLPPQARLPLHLIGWNKTGDRITFTARANPEVPQETYFTLDTSTQKLASTAEPQADQSAELQPRGLPANADLIARDKLGLVWKETTPHGVFVRASDEQRHKVRTILTLNHSLADVDLGRTIHFNYTGGNGTQLQAAVLLPPNYRPGDKLPVITWVYGGATLPGADEYFFDPYQPGIYNLRLYAAHGYAVLIPSIPLKRDGTEDHLTAITPSVVNAVDKLVAMGIADTSRVGVMGQSYGGYTALALATQTDRFHAIVAVSPLSDLTAFYGSFDANARGYPGIEHEKSGNVTIAEIATAALHGPPYERPERYRRNSPLTFVDKVTAPVLLIHGERDARGSMYQSEAFFMGLWRQGKTARIIRYWGEDHALDASPATVRSAVPEITAWFDKYLRSKPN